MNQFALGCILGDQCLAHFHQFFVTPSRGVSLSIATRSRLQASPPRVPLVWHALRRALLWPHVAGAEHDDLHFGRRFFDRPSTQLDVRVCVRSG